MNPAVERKLLNTVVVTCEKSVVCIDEFLFNLVGFPVKFLEDILLISFW